MADRILQAYEFHPLANIFPLIEGQAYQDLMADILNYGVREPIWLYEGKILDGRNRYRAATAMRVEFETSEYTGDNPVAFVVSLNLHRRHLNESQRSMVGAKLANIKDGEFAGNQHVASANLPTPHISQSDAAEMLNVSTRMVTAATKVLAEAPEEVSHAVEAGTVSINRATQFQALPERRWPTAQPSRNVASRFGRRCILKKLRYAKLLHCKVTKLRWNQKFHLSLSDSLAVRDLKPKALQRQLQKPLA